MPYMPKRFVKTYGDVGTLIRNSIGAYVKEVKDRSFPAEEHVFTAADGVVEQLYGHRKEKVESNS